MYESIGYAECDLLGLERTLDTHTPKKSMSCRNMQTALPVNVKDNFCFHFESASTPFGKLPPYTPIQKIRLDYPKK